MQLWFWCSLYFLIGFLSTIALYVMCTWFSVEDNNGD